MILRCFVLIFLYLLDISFVRSACVSEVMQQLQSMHAGASEVVVTWLGDAPQASDTFLAIEGHHISMKPHVFTLVCADGKQYRGKAEPCMRMPVLTNDVQKGDIIQNVDYQNIPCRLLNKRAVQAPENLVGMQAKVSLKASQPILEQQIEKPKLVKRGDSITIQYQTPFFVITNQGVAQRDGAAGDVIGVTCQKKTLSVKIVSHNLAQLDRL